MTSPLCLGLTKGLHKRRECRGRCGVHAEQNYPRMSHGTSTLHRNLPEIFVERQHYARFRFRQFQKNGVSRSGTVCPSPQHIMTLRTKFLDDRLRKVLVGKDAHLRGDWKSPEFVREKAGVR